ncbi:MAG: BON domain-containing protein [Burkholderiaceae bacterium]
MKSTQNATAVAIVGLALFAGCDRKAPDAEMTRGDQSAPVTPVIPAAPVAPATPTESSGAMSPSTNGSDSNAVNPPSDSDGSAVADAAITAQVKAALLLEPDLKSMEINVETVNGIVTLTGPINTAANLERAFQIAKEVDGVKSVNNQLSVQPPA